jgi:hypothetical protein
MKTLREEADTYSDNQLKNLVNKSSKFECMNNFIAGANSKYVQIEKIKAQIELMKELYENSYIKSGSEFWKKKFIELEQQFKQLEDENHTIQT